MIQSVTTCLAILDITECSSSLVPHYARLLADNFGLTARFSIEQVAVSHSSGRVKIYRIAENAPDILGKYFDVPALRGIASLDRDHVLKHLAPEYHSIVESDTVECLTVKELLKRNHIEQIDLLHIDAKDVIGSYCDNSI